MEQSGRDTGSRNHTGGLGIQAGRQQALRRTYRNSSHHSSQGNTDSGKSTNRCRA